MRRGGTPAPEELESELELEPALDLDELDVEVCDGSFTGASVTAGA
jgi:hypothetical protein